MFELFGGESWSKSIKRSDSVGLVRVEIAIASLLLEDEDDMVWKKLQKNKGGLSSEGIFNVVLSLKKCKLTVNQLFYRTLLPSKPGPKPNFLGTLFKGQESKIQAILALTNSLLGKKENKNKVRIIFLFILNSLTNPLPQNE